MCARQREHIQQGRGSISGFIMPNCEHTICTSPYIDFQCIYRQSKRIANKGETIIRGAICP